MIQFINKDDMKNKLKFSKQCFYAHIFNPSLLLQTSQNSQNLPAVGTKEILGKLDGVEIEAIVQSPSAQETPLQVVCLFEYTEGDIFNSPPALPKELNGMVHVDEALHGLITELRKTNKFEGKFLKHCLLFHLKILFLPKNYCLSDWAIETILSLK